MGSPISKQEIRAAIVRDLASAIHYRKLAFKGVEKGGPLTPEFYEKRACDFWNDLEAENDL